jgi:hypothetical protein
VWFICVTNQSWLHLDLPCGVFGSWPCEYIWDCTVTLDVKWPSRKSDFEYHQFPLCPYISTKLFGQHPWWGGVLLVCNWAPHRLWGRLTGSKPTPTWMFYQNLLKKSPTTTPLLKNTRQGHLQFTIHTAI